ncbi:MAG: SH3 domain-containing protein, partial [Lachnospiraceae bacterium]|nr:SH3 domain-containing protein [Lachnospiraceae bacterium]
MKKVIPVIIAVILIFIIGGVAFGRQLIEKYSYSDEQADLYEYFHIIKEDEVAVVLQNEIMEEKAVLAEGVCYFDLETVHKYFNTRFYVDQAEGLILYTTPLSIIRTAIGSSVYDVDGEETNAGYRLTFSRVSGEDTIYYIAADYIKQYTNFSYELFEEPWRMQVYTQWGEQELADVKRKNAVRLLGGVKSPVLTKVSEGDTLVILDRMETWCKVKTGDGYIGYIENKILENERTQMQTPVTDYVQPEYTSLTREHRIALGWHAVYSKAGNDTLSEVTAGTKGLNVISPTWFSLSDNEGHFQSFAAKSYVDRAHAMGLEVWGAVDNFNYKN